MAFPSFSLQSTSVLSDPCWGTWILALFPCALGSLGVCALVRELGKIPGYRR